ncbi:MAG: decaprenyl-phosphate phosphoribosyltransferase [Chloroflexia bacterium]|nr:decaprenyl-phosphate phosphoribosyltransferase [Chloroflexia bacterium]
MRPTQWLKNGLVFAGLVFGGKLFELQFVGVALLSAIVFCLLSSGFYLINDVLDMHADRLHPEKRLRPVASGALSARNAAFAGSALVLAALAGAAFASRGFLLAALAYAALMIAYNLRLKQIVILDVFAIAMGFVLRAVGGAVAVDVSISPWLLLCTMLLALLVGFGKRRHELMILDDAGRHRRNLNVYSQGMLDQSVAIAAAGTLIAYSVYTFESESAPFDHRMMLTVPIVAYGVFRYLYLLYQRGQGGAPETMLLSDRGLLLCVVAWGLASTVLFYFAT